MIPALLIGREGSIGFPGKNLYPVLGRPLMLYPLLAGLNSKYVDEMYVSTDSAKIKEISLKYGAKIIDRPSKLATKESLGEDVFVHGYKYIKNVLKKDVELIVLLFCNAATILSSTIDSGIEILRQNPSYDSAVTVSAYNMWSPIRARRVGADGLLHPFIPFENYPKSMGISCDRDSQGDVYFVDCAVSVVQTRCLDNLDYGILPQKWMGRQIFPLIQWGGCDVDFEWQIPLVEYWLKQHGFAEDVLPYTRS